MDVRILGSFEVASNSEVVDLGPPKQRAVLAALLIHANEVVPTDRLIAQVWGEHPPRTAAHSIQIYVSELRKALEAVPGGPTIETRPPGYVLRLEPDAVDARRFERLVTEGSREIRAGELADGAAELRAALELWRGRPLVDFAYEEFAQPEIRHLEELHLTALEELGEADLASGRAQDALAILGTAIEEDPLRERPRELHMLALYRAGRQAEALRAFQRFRGLLAEELGLDPTPELRRLHERILLHDPSLAPAPEAPVAGVRNPYKGLRAFSEGDADDFFGRERLVDEALGALARGRRLLALVGPSGCGKSSVANAGLVSAVRRGRLPGSERWLVVTMTPGRHPFEELGAALRRAEPRAPADLGSRLASGDLDVLAAVRAVRGREPVLLVIDQFEELFSATEEPERLRFLDELTRAVADPGARLSLLLTLRADFYDRPLQHTSFAPAFTAGIVNVLPMTADEIREAVVGPARRVGVEVDPALLVEIVADTSDQPGALPLLQYALTELFEHRSGARLTLEDYRAIGGLRGALSRRAEEVFGRLDDAERDVALQVFLRLVALGRGTKDSRRRVPVSELTGLEVDTVALSNVLDGFGRSRLLSFDRDPLSGHAVVEVAHEALLWEWERLREWIEGHRVDLARNATLAAAAEEWEGAGRHQDFLLTGTRLEELDAWRGETRLRLTDGVRAFLDAGLERRRAEEAEARARLEDRRRLERRARTRLGAAIAAVILLTAGIVYVVLDAVVNRPADVALLWDGYGDGGWSDMIAAGFDPVVEEFGLDAQRLIVPTDDPDPLVPDVRRLSEEGVNLIVVGDVILDRAGVEAVAADHPETRYVVVDAEGSLANVTYIAFDDEEGSYLAGAAAALRSRTGVIGFVGGSNLPLIWKFEAGYVAGARAVRPDVRVLTTYLDREGGFSGFADPVKGSKRAARMYLHGADVIFAAAGISQFGVFDAADRLSAELGAHLWTIGADSDMFESLRFIPDISEEQTAAWRPHVLTSMVKRLDTAIFAVMSDYARGALVGGIRRFGLAEGGVDLSYSGEFIDDLRPVIEDLRARIVAGQIDVPTVPKGGH